MKFDTEDPSPVVTKYCNQSKSELNLVPIVGKQVDFGETFVHHI